MCGTPYKSDEKDVRGMPYVTLRYSADMAPAAATDASQSEPVNRIMMELANLGGQLLEAMRAEAPTQAS